MKQLLFALKQKDSRYGGLTVTTLTSLNGSPTRARARRPAPASKASKRPEQQQPATCDPTVAVRTAAAPNLAAEADHITLTVLELEGALLCGGP